MDNLALYNKVRAVPDKAVKPILAGRLKGKSDINPMWRIKELTEQFGVCGFGWKYVITKQWTEFGGNNEISAFVNIDLFVKMDGQWSEAIPGTGGSSFVAMEKKKDENNQPIEKPYTSDECFKMALTDAISVACKALGFGADIYWDADNTKYNRPHSDGQNGDKEFTREDKIKALVDLAKQKGFDQASICKKAGISDIKFIKNEQIDSFTVGFKQLPDKVGA